MPAVMQKVRVLSVTAAFVFVLAVLVLGSAKF